jgi:hypothetical protein
MIAPETRGAVVQDHSAQRRSPDPFGILLYWMTSPLTAVSMAENSSAPAKTWRVIMLRLDWGEAGPPPVKDRRL